MRQDQYERLMINKNLNCIENNVIFSAGIGLEPRERPGGQTDRPVPGTSKECGNLCQVNYQFIVLARSVGTFSRYNTSS